MASCLTGTKPLPKPMTFFSAFNCNTLQWNKSHMALVSQGYYLQLFVNVIYGINESMQALVTDVFILGTDSHGNKRLLTHVQVPKIKGHDCMILLQILYLEMSSCFPLTQSCFVVWSGGFNALIYIISIILTIYRFPIHVVYHAHTVPQVNQCWTSWYVCKI